MKVRDHSVPLTEYRGRYTEALDQHCPCRPCYQPHDFGGRTYKGEWVPRMKCATRENQGCPWDDLDPVHQVAPRGKQCRRCHTPKTRLNEKPRSS